MSPRQNLNKLLTIAYLISAFAITAATSKGSGVGTYVSKATTNFAVRSNCPSRPDVVAIRIQNGRISQALAADGSPDRSQVLDFTHFGFPLPQLIIGLDQTGIDDSSNRRCMVSSKQSQPNPTYDPNAPFYSFIQPGYLTTVNYDCYAGGAYSCSTQFTELPAGELSNVAAN